MIRIAVVDDEMYVCEQIKKLLLDYQFKYNIDFEIDIFLSCEELLEKIRKSMIYHLIFLDIEFPAMNGVMLGKIIRNNLSDIKTQIVFVSYKESYAMDLFSIQPFDFIIKPIDKKRVFPCISKYLKYYVNSNLFFTYTLDNVKHKIAISEIIYIQSERKKLRMFTITDEISFYCKFNDAVNNGLKNDMVVIKRGLAVNINHIVDTDFETVLLTDGTRLKISDGYRDSFISVISDRIGG